MIPSKTAALLTLVGSLVVGAVGGYAVKGYVDRPPDPSDCPQLRSERDRNFRTTIYADLEMNAAQRQQWDSLIDLRRKTVSEIFAIPRAREDSIRSETWVKLKALLTPAQITKMNERSAAMREVQEERQKRCDNQTSTNKNKSNRY